MYNFIDSLLPFRRKREIAGLNFYQFLVQRYGIGLNSAKYIILSSGCNPNMPARDVPSTYVIDRIRKLFVNSVLFLDKNLKEYMLKQINHHIRIGSYKGVRHVFQYPCRGQRTRSNAKTRKRSKLRYLN